MSDYYRKTLSWGHELTPEGCLVSRATQNAAGYAVVAVKRKLQYAHRIVADEWFHGIPRGLVVDHECHNEATRQGTCAGGNSCRHRRCINPAHLTIKTHGENTSSSEIVRGNRVRLLEKCKRGHEFTEENTYYPKSGSYRQCRECKRMNYRAWWHRTKVAQ